MARTFSPTSKAIEIQMDIFSLGSKLVHSLTKEGDIEKAQIAVRLLKKVREANAHLSEINIDSSSASDDWLFDSVGVTQDDYKRLLSA